MSSDFSAWQRAVQEQMEQTLENFLPSIEQEPKVLHEAMHYAVLDGGKRIRPLLVYAAGELFEADEDAMARAAAAVEMIHAYSLVHDDMPCMDDDDLRRGKATVHKKYDEATALLVGDALQSQAFLVLAEGSLEATRKVAMLSRLAQAAGSYGMCGGQAIDCAAVGHALSLQELEHMHKLKTGALLEAAVMLGAWAGKTLLAAESLALHAYSQAIGLAFQVVDDILDATADSATLGKTAGKDAAHNKPTYVSLLGLDASLALAEKLRQDAHSALLPFGDGATRLRELADLIVQRKA
jgi:farnesyl diphosphate synthase